MIINVNVYFNPNGATNGSAYVRREWDTDSLDTCTITVPGSEPIRAGYSFDGWALTNNALSGQYHAGDLIEIDTAYPDVTVYAVWTPVIKTVTFNANGGSDAPAAITFQEGTNVTIPLSIPTKSLCVFLGWATTDTADAPQYSMGAKYMFDDDITLYAVFSPERTIPIVEGAPVLPILEAATITLSDRPGITHDVEIIYAGHTHVIAQNVTTSCTWTPPASLANEQPEDNVMPIVVQCTTYYNGQNLGKEVAPGKLIVNFFNLMGENYDTDYFVRMDNISFTNLNQSNLRKSAMGGNEYNVPGDSIQFSWDLTTSPYGTTVDSLKCEFEGVTQNCPITSHGTVTFNDIILRGLTSNTRGTRAKFTLIDTRRNKSYFYCDLTVHEREVPFVEFETVPEMDDDDDHVINVKYRYRFSPVNNYNTAKIKIYWTYNGTGLGFHIVNLTNYVGSGTYTVEVPNNCGDVRINAGDVVLHMEAYDWFTTYEHAEGTIIESRITGVTVFDVDSTGEHIAFHNRYPVRYADLDWENPDIRTYDHFYKNKVDFHKGILIKHVKTAFVENETMETDFAAIGYKNSNDRWEFFIPSPPILGKYMIFDSNNEFSIYKMDGTSIYTNENMNYNRIRVTGAQWNQAGLRIELKDVRSRQQMGNTLYNLVNGVNYNQSVLIKGHLHIYTCEKVPNSAYTYIDIDHTEKVNGHYEGTPNPLIYYS